MIGLGEDDLMGAIIVGYIITLLGAGVAYFLSRGKSLKRKYIVWGVALMVPISPTIAFSVGLTYARIIHNAWAALMMWIIFPVIFIIGLILLLVGIFKKNEDM
ncbi:hypothetical protein ACFFIS_01810 [Virgibacillus soli]|uniref:Major facilitator superfamily (MFS) profile domain-containing protein n=1 Tax=Paracerasibacillus soli TaxID=480284 RepID=A0ABU5CUU8_9BACI|nr:hypothetical protein [Virgibacillus soli]MDY0410148.1 hypothetical protein [Virgibacillus soli]